MHAGALNRDKHRNNNIINNTQNNDVDVVGRTLFYHTLYSLCTLGVGRQEITGACTRACLLGALLARER
jgi:hypothetical protein